MTRALLPDLRTPVELGRLLPGIYQYLDQNIMRVSAALDTVIAPVWLVLDNVHHYFEPATAPFDFVEMLAAWVGLPIDQNWRDDQTRRLVANAVELHKWRGTRKGLAALVEAYCGVPPAITESGATTWAAGHDTAPGGEAQPAVRIKVELPPGGHEDLPRLTRLIAGYVPAHMAVSVEIARPGSVLAD